jgi:lipopolysaccharide heptosyltransferase I
MRVILVRLSALGDIIHTWPLAQALREARPDMHVTWVVEEPFRPMVEGHPAVDTVLEVATSRWRRRPLAGQTRAQINRLKWQFHELRPELAIDPQGVLKSALITRWTGAPSRVALARPWRREWITGFAYTASLSGSTSHRHVVATNMELVRSVGGTPPDQLLAPDGGWLLDRLTGRRGPAAQPRTYAVLLSGAGQNRKLLPIATLAEVARRIVETGLQVMVAWGPGERARAAVVSKQAGLGVEPAPPTDLAGLTLLLAGARVVVGGDTGPVHLAASLGIPTAAVFTVTDWRRNGPLGASVEVVSGAAESNRGPAASARATPVRPVRPEEILEGVRRLLDRS